jgi:NRAMP (natural resistance-associated macrophage protein)-like metal ion transporter
MNDSSMRGSGARSAVETSADPVIGPSKPRLLGILGPGLVTGASDDDPSGIATYSQAGAQLGFGCLWMMLFSYPLMAVTQEISARIGRITGEGLAGTIRRHYPPWLVNFCVLLLLAANILNLGADLGAMGDVAAMVSHGPRGLYVVLFGAICLAAQVLLQYTRYVAVLKWTALVLFAYLGTVLMVKVPWGQVAYGLFVPRFSSGKDFIGIVVAVMGTTISPYLFFWQSSQEVEDLHARPQRDPLIEAPRQAPGAFRRIRLDTYFGMAISNFVALAIMVTTAATLHRHGVTNIQTSAQAAQALRPVAGRFASLVFALGIIGTGFMAVPILAGSAAYAIGEARRWPVGLARKPMEAKAFYLVLAVASIIGVLLNFLSLDPIRALYWSAVINGVLAAPIMTAMMLLASRHDVMGAFTLPPGLKLIGWIAVLVMAASTAGLVATLLM